MTTETSMVSAPRQKEYADLVHAVRALVQSIYGSSMVVFEHPGDGLECFGCVRFYPLSPDGWTSLEVEVSLNFGKITKGRL